MNSFLQGKKSLSLPGLHLPPGLTPQHAPGAAARRAAGATPAGKAEPQVETVKEGDKVVRLIITCGCGERVEIECLYPAGT